ncbi:MAG: alpha-glucan family phosphorylase [Pseudomonadota bacterium]
MTGPQNGYLFETSWEVCNKAGGIYTVITSKLPEALAAHGDQYFMLGPDLKTNLEFEETDEACWAKIREGTAIQEIPCRFGRWKIPGEPKVILVGFGKKYNRDQLLYWIWEDYGVDSIAGGWDYVEPVMFSYACGEVIATIYNLLVRPQGKPAVAQFHDWMCGAGLLALKKKAPEIATVFTTHATILGRCLAGAGMDIYAAMEDIVPQREASTHNIAAKYSMETAAAREADCFTTVSEITAAEAKNFLGRCPDIITPNGLDIEKVPDLILNRDPAMKSREKLLAAAARFLGKDFPANTKIFIISGRYEFRNKGLDVFLKALGRLDKEIADTQPVLAFLFIIGGHTDLIPALQGDSSKWEPGNPPISTHRLQNEASDPILQTCNRVGLKNLPQNRVHVIFSPAYLNGHDGLINMTYYEALSGCDLGVFPSYYEPWGYTPLESAAYGIPTVTTDQAGFGLWVRDTGGADGGIILLNRRGQSIQLIENHLHDIFTDFIHWEDAEIDKRRKAARTIALKANWKDFFQSYLLAYEKARLAADDRSKKLALADERTGTKFTFAGTASTQPHFRTFTAVATLPDRISRLRELAYNLWWTWHPKALDLYASLDPKIWPQMNNNPVMMLETLSPECLLEASQNQSYLNLYEQVMKRFDDYMNDREPQKNFEFSTDIKWSSPIAYFSTEYGLHECLPIYSGGLATLSGDHLKTASDVNLPLVGVGLLYKNGYFKQAIDKDGQQIAEYPENDFSTMPVQIVRDDRGKEVQISLDLPGRTLYANIWEVKVGRITLYLLDSDVTGNTPQDRRITSRLYSADQRTRIEQEILLGMGGVRLLNRMGIKPRVYHINEGHSAFLLFELIANYMTADGLSFDEASEVVRGSAVFTTHTPVEAGNERFNRDMMEHYFCSFVNWSGMSWSQFWELGRKESGDDKPFFMNILAFRLTHQRNAVSLVHGQLSRHIWRDVWKGYHEDDIPIRHVTNGAHILSYLAPRMKELLDTYLGMNWERHLTDRERWKRVHDIPDTLLWRTRHEIKQRTIDMLRDYLSRSWSKYGYSKAWREELYSRINPEALLIGFSRRFAPYKRANMLLSDPDRLSRIINHETRPVHIVFAGKAHPNDEAGRNILRQVIEACKDERFRGRIFFIENYDISIARHFVQGVDVWLNTPRRPYEASGTSGIKVVANGVLNLSVSDGWWCEGYDGVNGWNIGPVIRNYAGETENADEEDTQSLYTLLENTVVPLYYDRQGSGIPERWIAMIKRSMESLPPQFNTERMLLEYYREMYLPTAIRTQELTRDDFDLTRALADWKRKIPMRFSSVKLLDVTVEGIHGDNIPVNEPLKVTARIDPGKLEPHEIMVELVIGRRGGQDNACHPEYLPMRIASKGADGIFTFSVEYVIRENGPYSYGLRVLPYNEKLASRQETGLVLWG